MKNFDIEGGGVAENLNNNSSKHNEERKDRPKLRVVPKPVETIEQTEQDASGFEHPLAKEIEIEQVEPLNTKGNDEQDNASAFEHPLAQSYSKIEGVEEDVAKIEEIKNDIANSEEIAKPLKSQLEIINEKLEAMGITKLGEKMPPSIKDIIAEGETARLLDKEESQTVRTEIEKAASDSIKATDTLLALRQEIKQKSGFFGRIKNFFNKPAEILKAEKQAKEAETYYEQLNTIFQNRLMESTGTKGALNRQADRQADLENKSKIRF